MLGQSFTDRIPASVSEEWDSLFKNNDSNALAGDCISSGISAPIENSDGFLPSQLLDNFASSLKFQLSTSPGTVLSASFIYCLYIIPLNNEYCGSNLAKDDASAGAPTGASSLAASTELSFMSSLMANLRPQVPPGQSSLLSSPTGSNQPLKTVDEVYVFFGLTLLKKSE